MDENEQQGPSALRIFSSTMTVLLARSWRDRATFPWKTGKLDQCYQPRRCPSTFLEYVSTNTTLVNRTLTVPGSSVSCHISIEQ